MSHRSMLLQRQLLDQAGHCFTGQLAVPLACVHANDELHLPNPSVIAKGPGVTSPHYEIL